MTSKHVVTVKRLYKTILQLHSFLPIELKAIGDQYVRSEFRHHKTCPPEFIPEFMQQWELYANTLKEQVSAEVKKQEIGQNLSVENLSNFSDNQIVQLHELMKETQKDSNQFNIKEKPYADLDKMNVAPKHEGGITKKIKYFFRRQKPTPQHQSKPHEIWESLQHKTLKANNDGFGHNKQS